MSAEHAIRMRVHGVVQETPRVSSYELRPVEAGPLPAFEVGAHIDLLLSPDLLRSYSLTNTPDQRDRYVIAVCRQDEGRGGSTFVHDTLKPGATVQVLPPRSLFGLDETAGHSLLIAGGIGITPLYCMIQRLCELGRAWHLVYCARTPAEAAFLDRLRELAASGNGRLDTYFNEEPGYQPPDFAALVRAAPADSHFYCCGPDGLMAAFKAATAALPHARVHTESFTPVAKDSDELGGFTVYFEHSGIEAFVPPGRTILDIAREHGIDAVTLCEEGTCGTCAVAVIEGEPLHRGSALSDEDKESGEIMLICCSGSRSQRLVIDL